MGSENLRFETPGFGGSTKTMWDFTLLAKNSDIRFQTLSIPPFHVTHQIRLIELIPVEIGQVHQLSSSPHPSKDFFLMHNNILFHCQRPVHLSWLFRYYLRKGAHDSPLNNALFYEPSLRVLNTQHRNVPSLVVSGKKNITHNHRSLRGLTSYSYQNRKSDPMSTGV